MSITKKEAESFGMSGTTLLARIVTGRGVGDLVEDLRNTKKSITVRLDPETYSKIEEYRKKAKTTKTAILEILITAGIEATENQIELDGQMGIEEFSIAPSPKKKGAKK